MIWWGVLDSKFSPWLPVKDHYATLVDKQRPDKPYWPDYAVLVLLPVATGSVVGTCYRLRDMQSYIGGVAIFTALLFALVIYVFQLRMTLLENPRVPRDSDLTDFVDQVFANVNYAVVVGVIATVASMAAAVTSADDGRINGYWSAVVVALGLHLMLVVFMCIKRIRAAYAEIKTLPRVTRT